MEELQEVLTAMRREADSAGVAIVTGDTKVVPRGKGDKIFINTTGVGVMDKPLQRSPIEKGDKIIVSGSIGDHGITIMAQRGELSFSQGLVSDCAHLNHLIDEVIAAYPESIRFMRDATRGGVASVLNEIVKGEEYSIGLREEDVPVKAEVQGICDILGLDPLYVANEGKVLFIVKGEDADAIVEIIKSNDKGQDAAIIGEVTDQFPGKTYVETEVGGRRLLPLLLEEQLPRIC